MASTIQGTPSDGTGDGDLLAAGPPAVGIGALAGAVPQPVRYLAGVALAGMAGLALVAWANIASAPLIHDRAALAEVAGVLAEGRNFAVFDLNINTRVLRDEHIRRLPKAPETAVLGASHWQEGHASLLPGHDFYNAHVHRDYYEDMLSVVEQFVRHDRLPRRLVITIRDKLFTPLEERADFLWVPTLPYYRSMAARLGLVPHPWTATARFAIRRDLFSLPLALAGLRRMAAPVQPHATGEPRHPTLDMLLPDGSIHWSAAHRASFTAETAEAKALSFAAAQRDKPPRIDPRGVEAIDRLIAFLKERGREVVLAHPPFNPVYYGAVRGSSYAEGLRAVEAVTAELAARHGLTVIGSFDPAAVGCEAAMYIDGEHANPECLAKVLEPFAAGLRARAGS